MWFLYIYEKQTPIWSDGRLSIFMYLDFEAITTCTTYHSEIYAKLIDSWHFLVAQRFEDNFVIVCLKMTWPEKLNNLLSSMFNNINQRRILLLSGLVFCLACLHGNLPAKGFLAKECYDIVMFGKLKTMFSCIVLTPK